MLFNFHILENILNLLPIRVLGSLGLTVAWLWSIWGGLRALFPSGEGSPSVLDDLSGRSFLKVGSQFSSAALVLIGLQLLQLSLLIYVCFLPHFF